MVTLRCCVYLEELWLSLFISSMRVSVPLLRIGLGILVLRIQCSRCVMQDMVGTWISCVRLCKGGVGLVNRVLFVMFSIVLCGRNIMKALPVLV